MKQQQLPGDPPALHLWREHALTLVLRLVVLVPLPMIVMDLLQLLRQGALLPFALEATVYAVIAALILDRRIPYRWRAVFLLGAGLLLSTYLLLSAGLVSNGRVYLIAAMVIAALMLSRRSVLLVWLSAAAALLISGLAFAGRPAAAVADLAQQITDPSALLVSGLATLTMGAIAATGAASLVGRLARSLRATEAALVERDGLNASLEQGVAERTSELERSLRYAEALASCSQTLLRQAPSDGERRAILEAALTGLREAAGVSCIHIYQHPGALQRSLAPVVLATVHAAGVAPYLVPPPPPPAAVPDDLARALGCGEAYGGPLTALFAEGSHIAAMFAVHGVRSLLMLPIFQGGRPWGLLYVADHEAPRGWDGPTIQLLRTAGEMVSAFQQGWETNQALAASEARLRALRDALPDLLFIVRSDGTFLKFYAPRHTELLVPAEDFVGRRIDDVMPPDVARLASGAIERVRTAGGMELLEYELSLGPRTVTFEARVVAIAGDELLVVVRDITERYRATEALREAKEAAEAADRAKTTFLAHISHEIRTPLTAVIGMTSLLRETALDPRQRECVATIRTGAETLLTIIGNILDFSKIEAGQMELNLQPFDLRACLDGAVDLVAHEAARKGLALSCAVDPAVPAALSGDGARLRQVVVNLLGNAVKFTERGAVTLAASGRPLGAAQYELELSISDTGIGIAPEQIGRIFDPFVQADSATTRRFGGTGLGLAISRQLIERMGGQIDVDSKPGAGTVFRLHLPLALAAAAPAERPDAPRGQDARPPERLRVLLAEDNPINQDVLRRLLESLGYAPDVVGDGAEALAAVARQPYDVVFMDIQMPVLDGEAATRQIRALAGGRQPHIIALTASALREDQERYLAAGMDAYLSKPVQREDLRDALARVARHRRPAPSPTLGAPGPGPVDGLVDWPMLEQLLRSMGVAPAQAAATILQLARGALAEQLGDLGAAVAADERARARALAHKLRGGCQQLGAVGLAAHCAAIEAAASQEGAPLAELLADARRAYEATLELIGERLGAPGA